MKTFLHNLTYTTGELIHAEAERGSYCASMSIRCSTVAGGTEGLIFVQNWTQELLERVPVP